MIRLSNVWLSLRGKGVDPGPIVRDVSVALPTNVRLAIVGDNPRALSEMLSMLAGTRKPDQGSIDRESIRCSPVVNSNGIPGRTLVGQLTAIQNIHLAASRHGLDTAELITVVESACQFGQMLAAPINNFDRPMRRKLEAALIAAIPFDCYCIDNLHEFELPVVWQFVHVARQRGAGILFTSRRPKQVRNFAELNATVRNESIEVSPVATKAPAISKTGMRL